MLEEAGPHQPENLSDKPFEAIGTEMKTTLVGRWPQPLEMIAIEREISEAAVLLPATAETLQGRSLVRRPLLSLTALLLAAQSALGADLRP